MSTLPCIEALLRTPTPEQAAWLLELQQRLAPAASPHLFLPDATGTCRVAVADVLYAETQDHACALVTATACHLVRLPLRELLAGLAPRGFVRIHRRYLLHPDRVSHLSKGRDAVKVGSQWLPVGACYRAALLARLPGLHLAGGRGDGPVGAGFGGVGATK